MKKIYALVLLFTSMNLAIFGQTVSDSVSFGPGYMYDVYYSLENGEVSSLERAVWDIAINTSSMSASILTNGGAGVELYMHPTADTTDWATLDTAGLSSWNILYNSDTTWEEGAFNQLASGHPDYGWGQYNSLNHNVYGHKLYVIKLVDGTYKKLWIKAKYSMMGMYEFMFANLDNSDEVTKTVDLSQYSDMNFLYYNLTTQMEVDYEPVSADWDILFTRYYDHDIPYTVVGVLSNYDVMVAEARGVGPDFIDYQSLEFSDHIKTIGSDWKSFNMGSFTYDMVDSLAYFVQTADSSVYKLVFSGFAGSSTGKTYFDVTEMVGASVNEITIDQTSRIYPNPASDELNISLNAPASKVEISMYNILGSKVYFTNIDHVQENYTIRLNDLSLHTGMYVVEIVADGKHEQHKVLIK